MNVGKAVDVILLSTVIVITIYLLVNNKSIPGILNQGSKYLNQAFNAAEGT